MMNHIEPVLMAIKARLKKWFKPRRIIVVSDTAIHTLHLHPWFQGSVVLGLLVMSVWMIYTSGQFVVFETMLSSKEGEIVHANKTNQTLVAEMDELQKNLKTLNQYLQPHKDPKSRKKKGSGNGVDAALGEEHSENNKELDSKLEELSEDNNRIINNIYDNVLARIDTVRDAFDVAGLNLDTLKYGNRKVSETKLQGAGGPFIPLVSGLFQEDVSPTMLRAKIDYLVNLEKLARTLPFGKPIPNASLSSGFGVRKDPMNNQMAVHKGLDLIGAEQAKVYVVGDGIVVRAGRYGAYGRFVEVDHGNGITTRYGHLNRFFVRTGQRMRKGQVIGLQGSTGRSTGSHLHYEVRVRGEAVDPMKFLKAGSYVF